MDRFKIEILGGPFSDISVLFSVRPELRFGIVFCLRLPISNLSMVQHPNRSVLEPYITRINLRIL